MLSRVSAAARAAVPPFHVMDVLAAAEQRRRSHGDLVSLAAGQPSSPAPAAVRAAAEAAVRQRVLGYTEQVGAPELREAIAGHYRRRYDLVVDPAEVVVTTGSSGAFLLAVLAAFDVGDRVAVTRPGYPAYRNTLAALGCRVVDLPCDERTGFRPTVAMLDALAEPIAGLVLASPANPTGAVLDPAELAALVTWCDEHGVQVLSDEVYHGISYDVTCASVWQTSREPVVLNSFSKYWCMTGWRLGWLLAPARLLPAVAGLAGNLTICPPAGAQFAALAAFEPESYAAMDALVGGYRANRDLLVAGLAELGLHRLAPADGAFCVYADVSEFTDDSLVWCRRMLADTGVAVVPGVDFDPVHGHRFVRFSVAGAAADLRTALDRLAGWLPRCRTGEL